MLLTLRDIQQLPVAALDVRMKCVECWSAKARWEGFTYQALADLVRPQAKATWLYFECADGYYEALPIEELASPRVLFAYRMDGELLLPEFGAPLRLVVPARYGYKWPKAITALRFQSAGRPGYWPAVGPYTEDGMIMPGFDHPLDLPGEAKRIGWGEITSY